MLKDPFCFSLARQRRLWVRSNVYSLFHNLEPGNKALMYKIFKPNSYPCLSNARYPPADTVSPGLTKTFSTLNFPISAAASGVLTAISNFIASRITICIAQLHS
jgi:hypothetical protein